MDSAGLYGSGVRSASRYYGAVCSRDVHPNNHLGGCGPNKLASEWGRQLGEGGVHRWVETRSRDEQDARMDALVASEVPVRRKKKKEETN